MTTPAQSAPAALIRVPAGTTAGAAVREAGLPGRGESNAVVVVADPDGKLRDLSWVAGADTEVRPVAADTEEGRSVIRHSAAHVLAQAVQELFPAAKLGIGPPITDGFYYDFSVAEPFTPEDLEKLEKRMAKIVKDGQLFDRRVFESVEQARVELATEPFKLELIDDKSGDPDVMEYYASALDLRWLPDPLPHPAQRGTLASADSDLQPAQIAYLKSLGAIAGDWETGALAWVANKNAARLLRF